MNEQHSGRFALTETIPHSQSEQDQVIIAEAAEPVERRLNRALQAERPRCLRQRSIAPRSPDEGSRTPKHGRTSRSASSPSATSTRSAICRAVSELVTYRQQEGQRIRSMQHRLIDDHFAESFLLRAYQDESLLSPRTLPLALKEWRTPSFPDFEEEKNVWRLFNAVTFSLGDAVQSNPQRHAAATIRLGALLCPDETVPACA